MQELANADETLFLGINGFVGTLPIVDRVAQWVVSDYLVPVGLALLLIVIWFMKQDRDARTRHQIGVLVALGSMSLSSLVVFILNMYYFRPRPFEDFDVSLLFYQPTDSSFPSNAVAAVSGIAFGIWGVNRTLGWMALSAVGLYGLARVYAGIHYPLDVIAGAAIAAPSTFLVFKLRDLLMPLPLWVVKFARVLRLA